jgi:hypothetical protein
MEKQKITLFRKAIKLHGMNIRPCADRQSLSDCFTVNLNKLYFWFNTEDGNTHALSMEV